MWFYSQLSLWLEGEKLELTWLHGIRKISQWVQWNCFMMTAAPGVHCRTSLKIVCTTHRRDLRHAVVTLNSIEHNIGVLSIKTASPNRRCLGSKSKGNRSYDGQSPVFGSSQRVQSPHQHDVSWLLIYTRCMQHPAETSALDNTSL